MARKEEPVKKRDYVCPYCFTKVDMNNIHYVCTGPTCAKTFASNAISTRNEKAMMFVSKNGVNEIDREKSLVFGKDPFGPDAIIAKQHIIRNPSGFCDVCRRPVYLRVCPTCHNMIPPGAEEEGNKIFVILGPKGVGKSHYIAVLINQLKNVISTEFHGVLNAANDSTTIKYRDVYYHRLFEEKRKLQPTLSFGSSPDAHEPLIFFLRILNGDKPQVFTFAFFDTAGEDLVSTNRMMQVNLNAFISLASGIVYLVDPMQVKYINQRIHVDNKPNVGPSATDILNNICQIIRNNKKLKSKDKIDIPIAVSLTKSDVLMKIPENEEESKVLFGLGSSLHIPREYGKYDAENFAQIDAELEEYIRRTVGPEFLQLVRSFKDYAFFAVSALGCNPTGSTLPRGVSPQRVEDPFLWLLSREGLR
ncbi:MAG: zinc ribbon domain-containing protein [Thermoplasmata archaeon]|jgi:GTPase SAR1 family protein|nr:zinc ribbon domain-containing protein [Thermoplasmata archaeon]MBR4244018.1 zinc ribbon domain-containing protein [Candidatus Methanomethylophilaceae archaeon]MBR6213530.1 zinc ribbon domain-containing protein [Candidatus Methanomethylophilaceae archaeon]